ncbi:hypothetical protein OIU76_027526 [Salix suchowensis]|nr:hypothetical protein OIU76_027526 [Salix suchowensis]
MESLGRERVKHYRQTGSSTRRTREEKEQELLEEVNDREEEAGPTHQTDPEIATSDTNRLFNRELNLIGNSGSMDSSRDFTVNSSRFRRGAKGFLMQLLSKKILRLTSTWRTPGMPIKEKGI